MDNSCTTSDVLRPTPLSIPKFGKEPASIGKNDSLPGSHCCDLCGKTYSQLSHLENHRTITHSLTLQMKNNYSPKTNHYRSAPVSVNETAKLHTCEECGKVFTRSYHLDRHKLIHSGIRPYKCTVCQKEFTRNYHLERHMYTHTGEKPYSCEVCAKAFSRTDKLKRHSLTHMMPTYKENR